jgi:hypothetical protein
MLSAFALRYIVLKHLAGYYHMEDDTEGDGTIQERSIVGWTRIIRVI